MIKHISIQKEAFSDSLKDELEVLIKIHYEEIALHKDYVDLNPFWEAYHKMEAIRRINIITAREDGVLIGYVVDSVNRSLHYKDHLFATNDVFFVHPDHRTGSTGLRMFKAAEVCLKAMGASVWLVQTKAFKSAGKLLERRGFKLGDEQYVKYIKGD